MRRSFWKFFPGGSFEAVWPTIVICALLVSINWSILAQSPTTGRIAGLVKDQNSAAVVRAEAVAVNRRTGEVRKALTDEAGYYALPLLTPGIYQITYTRSLRRIVDEKRILRFICTSAVRQS